MTKQTGRQTGGRTERQTQTEGEREKWELEKEVTQQTNKQTNTKTKNRKETSTTRRCKTTNKETNEAKMKQKQTKPTPVSVNTLKYYFQMPLKIFCFRCQFTAVHVCQCECCHLWQVLINVSLFRDTALFFFMISAPALSVDICVILQLPAFFQSQPSISEFRFSVGWNGKLHRSTRTSHV